jgi:hypothetical protein
MASSGSYGFRIDDGGSGSPLLNAVPDDWPSITLSQVVTDESMTSGGIDESGAQVGFITGGGAIITRSPRRAELRIPVELSPEELAHPFLAPIASAHAYWMGWLPFHAGAVIVAGRAWGIIGEREAGKSTLLAALALRNVPVIADDLVVVNDHIVYAGPRTLDLRHGAAEQFGVGRDLGVVGMRERWRFDLAPVPLETPLGGWIFPKWGNQIAVSHTPAAERLRRLAPGRTVLKPDIDAKALMYAAAFPSVDFERPRLWEAIDEGLDVLLDRLGQLAR